MGLKPSILIARDGNIWQSQNVMVTLPASTLHRDMLFWEKEEAIPPSACRQEPIASVLPIDNVIRVVALKRRHSGDEDSTG